MGTDAQTTGGIYDELMPMFSDTGRFDPKALAVLRKSFVEMKTLPEEPDMGKLYTEAFLPATGGSNPMTSHPLRSADRQRSACEEDGCAGQARA